LNAALKALSGWYPTADARAAIRYLDKPRRSLAKTMRSG
jgi:hypothetical protein